MKVSVLMENRPSESDGRLGFEWGLSLHVALEGRAILFDTGASGRFVDNAERLSVDLAAADVAVLSHHHSDHGGGLRRFLALNPKAKVYLGERPEGECWVKVYGVVKRYAGLERTLLADFPERFEVVERPVEIVPDVFLIPRIAGAHPTPAGNRHLFVKRDGAFVPDAFAHELVMAVKENGRLVVFTGCSHSGVLNMVDAVIERFPGVPIEAVIGGFHLTGLPPFSGLAGSKEEVREIAAALLAYPIATVYTGHCTGEAAFAVLKSVMGERIVDLRTGARVEI
jgi:7,8-dihydropterin-6-yl-methyl-4-(beta-D-ribofuranosyl)aminobenzene 5'-phosphate synthase